MSRGRGEWNVFEEHEQLALEDVIEDTEPTNDQCRCIKIWFGAPLRYLGQIRVCFLPFKTNGWSVLSVRSRIPQGAPRGRGRRLCASLPSASFMDEYVDWGSKGQDKTR